MPCNSLTVSSEKFKIVSFNSSRMKNIVLFPLRWKFPVKLIRWITFGSALKACYVVESIAIDKKFCFKYG